MSTGICCFRSKELGESILRMLRRIAVCAVVLMSLFASAEAQATDIVLDSQGGTGVYTTLADAFAAAKAARERLRGENVDMGCYENPNNGLMLLVR